MLSINNIFVMQVEILAFQKNVTSNKSRCMRTNILGHYLSHVTRETVFGAGAKKVVINERKLSSLLKYTL